MLLIDIAFNISWLTTTIPLALILRSYNRQSDYMKWLAVILCISFICDSLGKICIVLKLNPNIIGSTYPMLSIPFISVFFYKIIKWNSVKIALILVDIIYLSFGLVNLMYIQALQINTYTFIFQSIIIIVLSLIFYYKLLKELPTQQLQRMPLFWIVSGFFFSYSGKLVIYTATQYLVTYIKDNLILVWSFHNLLSVIANLLIATGAWLTYKNSLEPRSNYN